MSGTKSSSRLGTVRKDGSFRYATRFLALEKGKRNVTKETNSSKACNCPVKSDGWKGSKISQNSKLPVKKANMKCAVKDGKKKSTMANHREKVVIVSKRSSSVSVVKSCNLRKSVSVKKVSYSTSFVLSPDEVDSDSEEELEEEEKKDCAKKKKTILKHTTSKVKSSVRESKKVGNKSTKKDKAIKILCDKLSSGKHKSLCPSRELRPRFPYNILQEWPTARTHRMASLNALAKVHVLYENEGRTVGENINDADETSLMDFLNENSDDDSEIKRELKPVINANLKKNEKSKPAEEKLKNEKAKLAEEKLKNEKDKLSEEKPKILKKEKGLVAKSKIPRRGKKRKTPEAPDQKDIIDTKICKRMANLNAQAILAASYQLEPKSKQSYKKSDKCYNSSDTDETEIDLSKKKIRKGRKIKKEKEDDEVIEIPMQTKKCEKRKTEALKNYPKDRSNKIVEQSTSKKISKLDTKNLTAESEVTVIESGTSASTVSNRSCTVASTAATTKVGLTQYTEVTQVQINTHEDSEIKEESKSERKIEQIVSNEDVAITQMYHYQSKTANESYCVQMQATYKPGSKAMTPPINRPPSSGMRNYVSETALPNAPNDYGRSSMLPSQAYPNMGPVSPVGMDQRLPRHYGNSAFTVPHYKHPQHMQFPPNEYGYYQPAGPLIQPVQDQVIHKPVPCLPQLNRHQTPQRPQPPSHCERFQTYESDQPRQNKPSMPSQPSQQKSVVPVVSTRSENLPQSETPPHFSRRQTQDDTRSRSLNNNPNTSFSQSSKHVRSPVMPTLYSSQENFRNYHTQKRVPNAFGSYNQSYERKDHGPKLVGYDPGKQHGPKLVGYDPASHPSTASKVPPHGLVHSRSSSFQSKEIQHQSSSSHSGSNFKNINDALNPKQRTWGFKSSHGTSSNYNPNASSIICNPGTSSNMCNTGTSSNMYTPGTSPNMYSNGTSSKICHDTSSNFIPYHSSSRKDLHQPGLNEVVYPPRPPPVITIDEDSPRDTKTYIQLEVPKNSHREKIVVVDVEEEIESKHIHSKISDKPNIHFDRSQDRIEKKHCSRHINLQKPIFDSRTQDKIENEHTHERNSNISKTASNGPQELIEKKHTAFSTPQDPMDKKHIHSRNCNIPKTASNDPQDKIEMKHTHSRHSDISKTTFDRSRDKIAPKKNIDHLISFDKTKPTFDSAQDQVFRTFIKTEEIIVENEPVMTVAEDKDIMLQSENCDETSPESLNAMFIDVKKKKESAVVRRAKLHGKERTFRDCYNRPLAPLPRNKKKDDILNISEQHLTKDFQPIVSLPLLVLPKLEKSPVHGWSWEGTPRDKLVYISNDDPPCIRRCYPSIRHIEGDVICVRDCVFLRSGPRKTDLPFVAKVTALWETPLYGEMTMSLLWYYRPEHTETDKKIQNMEDEIFASKHRDTNSVACIEDKCYVLTYAEYCRYRKKCRMMEDSSACSVSLVPEGEEYPRKIRLPPLNVSPDLVLFCKKVYDYRQKRLLKNPV